MAPGTAGPPVPRTAEPACRKGSVGRRDGPVAAWWPTRPDRSGVRPRSESSCGAGRRSGRRVGRCVRSSGPSPGEVNSAPRYSNDTEWR